MGKLREQILSVQDIKTENVSIPEWDTEVQVRGLSGASRNRILNNAIDKKGNVNLDTLYSDLVLASTHDPETGEAVFAAQDRDALNAKSGSALERIARVAMRLSGLDEEAMEVKTKN